MKKGFTMIELIFVIVILGILASVAVPRLAATREDAEVSAAVANLRTLISDASAYYVANGHFNGAKWRDLTNVPLRKGNRDLLDGNAEVTKGADDGAVYLSAGGVNCIVVRVADRTAAAPAHILFRKDGNKSQGLCKEILEADAVKAFVEARVEGVQLGNNNNKGAIAIGSSTTIY